MTIDKNVDDDLVMGLLKACKNSNMEQVKYYLTSPLLENKPNINDSREMFKYNSYTPLMCAVEANDINLVRYLLLSPDLNEHANINHVCNNSDSNYGSCALSIAAERGLENLVEFFLSSTELKENANIFPTVQSLQLIISNGEREIKSEEHLCYSPLSRSLLSNNINILHIILSQPESKDNEQLVMDIIDDSLYELFEYKRTNTLTYLLVNQYIEKNPQLEQYVESITDRHFYNTMLKLMNDIDLKFSLDNTLKDDLNTVESVKI